ncbi:MAG: hypothetical protein LAO56_15030 [Acidobacteriia bacterium]|nr:hypothetical protein [Terriglobia bacterium]
MKYVFWIVVVVGVIYVAWQFAAPELANVEFQDELHDLSTQAGSRTGLSSPKSDEELRTIILRKAEGYDILLEPKQVMVTRSGEGADSVVYLAVDYTVPVHLPGYTVTLHFAPTSRGAGSD